MKFQTKLVVMILILILLSSSWLTYHNLNEVENIYKEKMKSEGFALARSIEKELMITKGFEERTDQLMAERILQACAAINLLSIEKMTNEQLIELAPKINVSGGIYVIGPDRKIVYSDVVDYVGWEYPAGHPMDPVFNGQQKTYMEEIRGDLITGELNKYGGMALDTPGYYVQIGIKATVIADIKKEFSPDVLLKRLDENDQVTYAVLLDSEGYGIAGTEEMKKDEPYQDALTVDVIKNGKEGAAEYIDPDTGQKSYDVQIPYVENGEVKGSIAIGISLERMEQALAKHLLNSLITTGITCIIAILVGVFVISRLVAPLKKLSLQLNDIAQGDFTIEQDKKLLNQSDELGMIAKAVQKMRMELSQIMNDLKKNAYSVEVGADQLSEIMLETSRAIEENAKAIEALAVSASHQAEEAEKVSSSAEHLGQNVDEGKGSIEEANSRVGMVNELSAQGEHIITELAKVTKESFGRTDAVADGIQQVEDTVKNMREFMERIRSISGQTNLLALNASIEAARAGDAGRGFAVVADEIRKLAEETNQTTEQVEVIIEEISNKTTAAADNIKAISDVTTHQRETLKQTLDIFDRIQGSIRELVEAMNRVMDTTDAVGTSKGTILSAVNVLAELTENLSATCEEISASTEEQTAAVHEVNRLTETNHRLASDLTALVTRFKTMN
ncbi:MAG: methyl-accepting chemotaxis protein [Bacillota bacterium]